MPSAWEQALKDSISEVYSTMFFMVPEPNPEVEAALGELKLDGWLEGSSRLRKDSDQVEIILWAPPPLARDLAANLTASEPGELGAEEVMDAYREMINMVVGGVLSKLEQADAWQMGLPRSQELAGGSAAELLAPLNGHIVLDLDGQSLLAGWREESA